MPRLTSIPLSLRALRRTTLGNQLGLMETLFGERISPEGICWVETATGIPWKVDLGNPCHRWMVYGDYADPGFWAWASNSVPENGIVIDSGTNIGQFLPYFVDILCDGRIIAFEPSPYCTQWVQECLAVNPNLPIELISKGLGREAEYLRLEKTEEAHGLWGQLSHDRSDSGKEVEVTTLTGALHQRDISEVSLWKLDVEGHELEALKGAEELLAEGKIRAIYVELRAENRREDVAYLEKHGYSAYMINRSGALKKIERHPREEVDLIFLPQ